MPVQNLSKLFRTIKKGHLLFFFLVKFVQKTAFPNQFDFESNLFTTTGNL